MEDRKRTIIAAVIVCVVLLAVVYSFCLNLFTPTPEIILADPNMTASQDIGGNMGDVGGIVVEVTPQTVQSAVASMERYESYSRTVTVEYREGEASLGTVTSQVWADSGWVKVDTVLASGMTEHSIVGDGQLWLWYDEGGQVYTGPAADMTADLMQRLPTYEDVLLLDGDSITGAGYEERSGQPCIYVEAEFSGLGYRERYWISVVSGLLVAAETEKEGVLVYATSSYEVVSPVAEEYRVFQLPDGTVLHSPEN